MNTTIPPSDHYQYFSHMFHSKTQIPFAEYNPDPTWDYPVEDRIRFEKLFLTDLSYVKDCKILDLGCHTGYFSYVMKWLGAQSVHGVNVRQGPLDVANYAFSQLNQTNYTFEQGDMEDFGFLAKACHDKDTVFLGLALEHTRNPYAIIETISNSNVKNFIIESTVVSDEDKPAVSYFLQSCESEFSAYNKGQKISIASCPNLAWFEMVLYFLNWRIEREEVYHRFHSNWFAVPGLTKFPPKSGKSVILHCKKFDSPMENNNYENS